MKCEQAKLNILRADAGELVPWRRSALARHLGACAECRQYRDDLRQLAEATRAEPQPDMDAFALRLIMNEAERVAARRPVPGLGRRLLDLVQGWERPSLRPAYVLAAAALLAGGVWLVRPQGGAGLAWNDGVDQQLERLQDTLALFSTDDVPHARANDLENIASELLEVEG
jgi:anti-sigma factor RsiW